MEEAVPGMGSAVSEPSIKKSSGGSTTDSVLPVERRADGMTSGFTNPGALAAGRETARGVSNGGSYTVPESQSSTTDWTALSTVLTLTSTEISTNCTSTLVEVPRQMAMRGAGGGLLEIALVSRYR